MPKTLNDLIEIKRHFLRSVNISLDFGRDDAIKGYILQHSANVLLSTTAEHLNNTQQKAFTWTGPYGGGKSLLALTVASLAGGEAEISHTAASLLQTRSTQGFIDYFSSNKPWLVLPITGTRTAIDEEIQIALDEAHPRTKLNRANVIERLQNIAEQDSEYEGVLLIIDELGKFLEHAAHTGGDIGFYQELAESAARCKGKLVVIGILHQSFEQYASRLGIDAQQEWAKVQGRYVDIPILASSDETLSLIGKAIQTNHAHALHGELAQQIAQLVPNQQQEAFTALLSGCWPLHPLTAMMLGPSSRKRYGQNERSVFSFLTSAEPLGFVQVTKALNADSTHSLYWPHHFWDYLKANFEPTILASIDGRKWSLTLDSLQRAEAIYPSLHVQIIKTIGLLELFRSSLGLYAKTPLLHSSLPASSIEVDNALQDLAQSSILIFRKHTESWAVYAGSDFDIDDAINKAKKQLGSLDLTKTIPLLGLNPIIARRYYAEKGAIRWLNRAIIFENEVANHFKTFQLDGNTCGEFLLVLPNGRHIAESLSKLQQELSLKAPEGMMIGVSLEASVLVQQLHDLSSLDYIRNHSLELHTDPVAMRELDARIQAIRLNLNDIVQNLFNQARWMHKGESLAGSLTQLASEIADHIYGNAPIVLSELINRTTLSSNAVKAQRELLRAMLANGQFENLSFESMSAPAGLYYTTLKTLGMHQKTTDNWQICKPQNTVKSQSALAMWDAAESLFFKSQQSISLNSLYELWSSKPFGLKKGLLPVFALAFYLSNRKHLAVYMDGVFTPDITEATLDEWLQDPKRVTWRFVKLDSSEQEILVTLTNVLSCKLGKNITQDPLDSARALVSIVYSTPGWTRRTEQLAPETKKLRQLLLHASDPHKVLFVDIPTLLGTSDANAIAQRIASATDELLSAFHSRLKKIESNVLGALDHSENWQQLNQRGQDVTGIGAEFKLEAFIARISTYKGQTSDIEGLLMLAISKPSKDWTDHDLGAGEVQLLQWASAFRRLEIVAYLRNKPSHRRGIGIVFGNQQIVTGAFDVAEQDKTMIESLSKQLLVQFDTRQYKKEVFLAALAEAGAKILKDLDQEDH